jgi:hypothetical protein
MWARDAVAAASGFIAAAQKNHGQECRAGCDWPTVKNKKKCAGICNSINRAVHAHNAAIDALNIYCAGPGWAEGAACDPQAGAEAKLLEAIATLNQVVANLKGALR